MAVTFRLGVYEAHGEDGTYLKSRGWTYHAGRKLYVTSNIARAAEFEQTARGEAKLRIDKFLASRKAQISASLAISANVEIPRGAGAIAAGHDYRPYQKAFVPFALARHSCLNADVPRLGKTVMSMGVANATPNLRNMLVVCQANAKTQWQADHDKWSAHGLRSGIIRGVKDNPRAPATIINYDVLAYHREWLMSQEWDLAVFDESQNVMKPESKRTAFLLGAGRMQDRGGGVRAKRRIFLTGTPIWTRPIDLWPTVRACDPTGLGANYWRFAGRYCGATKENDWDASGRINEEELQFKLRSSMMIRREKSDVMAEIPPNRQTIILPKDGLEALVDTERSLVANKLAELQAMLDAKDMSVVDKYGHLATPDEDAEFSPLSTARRDLALAKVKMSVEWVKANIVDQGEKVVLFAHHRDVVKKIAAAFPGSAVIIGGMSEAQRDAEKVRFQTDPNCRVIVCNIRAGGTAISLSAADVVVFIEMSWVPSEMDQAEERIWLPEKTVPMSIFRLVVEDSLDSTMAAVLDFRQDSIDRSLSARHLGYGTSYVSN